MPEDPTKFKEDVKAQAQAIKDDVAGDEKTKDDKAKEGAPEEATTDEAAKTDEGAAPTPETMDR